MKKIKEWVRRGTALTLAVLLCLSGVPGTAWADIRTEPEKYAVHLGPCENGAVVFEGSEERTLTYAVDESVCLAPRADPGYILGSLDVADEYGNQILPDRENGRYIFLMPGADVTVSAVFYPREKPDVSPTEETTGEDGGGPLEGIAGEYTAALADTENGSVAFAGVDGTELGFYAGDTISLVMSADKGYEPCAVRIDGRDGETIRQELEGETFSFEMPETDIAITVDFKKAGNGGGTMIEEYIAENLNSTINQDENNARKTAAHVDVDKITASDLVDTGHTVYVSYTLADGSMARGQGMDALLTANSGALMGIYEDVADVYEVSGDADYWVAFVDITKMNRAATVIGADFCDTDVDTPTDFSGQIKYDKDKGIIYIPKSLYYNEDNKEKALGIRAQILYAFDFGDAATNVAVAIDNGNRSVEAYADNLTLKAPTLDITLTIPVVKKKDAGKVSLKDFRVYLNGSETAQELSDRETDTESASAYYDPRTGELTIATAPFTLKSVRVEITRKGVWENITSFVSAASSYFVTAVNAAKYTLVDDADDVSALPGTKLTGINTANLHAGQLYNDDDGYWYYGNEDLYDTSADWSGMSSAVEAIYRTYKYCYVLGTEGANITSSKVDNYNAYLYEKIVDADKNVTWDTLMKYTDGTDLGIAKPTTAGGKPTPYNLAKSYNFAMTPPHGKLRCIGGSKSTDAEGNAVTQDFGDTSQWNVTVTTNNSKTTNNWRLRALAAHCAHAGSGNEEVKDNTWSKRNTYVRILYVDNDYNYMILGMAGPSGTSSGGAAQSACAIYKVKIKPSGSSVSVSKKCAGGYEEIVEDNSCYKLNARYGLYTSKADARADTNSTDAGVYRIATFKLSENGKSNAVTKDLEGSPLIVGKTYYIKEIKAGTGYRLDPTVYSVSMEAGEEKVLETEDIPVYATAAVEKKDADTSNGLPGSPMVSLADTQFQMNHYFGYETDLGEALSDERARSWRIKTVKETGGDQAEHYIARPDHAHKVSGSDFYVDKGGNCVLPLGTYTLQETQTTKGLTKENMYFQANGAKIPSENQCMLFNIKPSTDADGNVSAKVITSNGVTLTGNVTFEAYNHETVGNLCIEKRDSLDWEKLVGAKFELIDALGKIVVPTSENSITGNIDAEGMIAIQDDGIAYVYNIPIGVYTLKEIYAPVGYKIMQDDTMTITGGVMSIAAEDNIQVAAGIKIQKHDAETGKPDSQGGASFAGAKFKIITLQNCKIGDDHYSSGDVVYHNLILDANGYAETPRDALTEGKYRLEETGAPTGYLVGGSVDFTIEKSDDGKIKDVTNGEVTDPVKRGGVKIKKVDKNTGESTPQGNASLAGAKFDIINLNAKPVSVNGAEYGYNQTVYTLTIGEDGTAQTAPDLLPYGHYVVRESEGGQPAGYLWNEKDYREFDIENDGKIVDLSGDPIEDPVKRGGLKIRKVDLDTKQPTPQGNATLAGAEFEIVNLSKQAVHVNGEPYEPGQVCALIITGEDGTAETAADLLPYGHYVVREAENGQPAGYLWNGETSREFDIENDGEIVDISGDPMEEPVIRGGVKVLKYDGDSKENHPLGQASLKDTEVVIYNESKNAVWVEGQLYSPGEIVYVMLTDEHGYAETPGRLLPYGTYRIVETVPPEGYLGKDEDSRGIYEQTFEITYDGEMADRTGYGDGMADYVKRGDIAVRKINSDTQKAMAGVSFKITSLATGESHVFTTDANGYYSSASSYCPHSNNTNGGMAGNGLWFGLCADGGNVDVDDSEGALPYDRYLIEELPGEHNRGMVMYSDTVTVSENAVTINLGNIENKEIAIGTTAKDSLTNTHYQVAESGACIVDTVYYQNLSKDTIYTLKASLMGKSSGEPVLDGEGKPVSTEKSFTPTVSSGSVDVEIAFDASGLAGSDVVVFEELYEGDKKLAEHKEITDDGQTVHYPRIGTLAADAKTGTDTAYAGQEVTIVDTVSYENLQVGRTYTLTGTLMAKETGQAFKDADGDIVTASRFFIPETPSGTVEMRFVFNGIRAAGQTLVAFEELSRGGVTYAVHTDIEDESQTVYFPKISTTAKAGETGDHIATAGAPVTITDTVAYENLHVGQEYVLSGTLMNKDTGEPLEAHGLPVEAETTFIPQGPSGTIEMAFTFDGTGLGGSCIVVFEKLQIGSVIVASHADLNDGGQTVYIPGIGTEATDTKTGDHVAAADKTVTVKDTVAYKNLLPGKAYTVHGVLVEKATGKQLMDGQKPVTAEREFTPAEASGTVELVFSFDGSALAGKAVVAYETVYYEGKQVAVHADISDENQTVYIPGIETTALDADTGGHLSKATDKVAIVDTVVYKNLAPGKEYTVTGTLMDKETGKAIEADGKAITSKAVFTPAEPDGSVEMTFTFDGSALAGKAVVAFEEIFLKGKKVAVHADISDENQTVYIPGIGTTALDDATKEHLSPAAKKMKIIDTVTYKNLVPGKNYVVSGTLMDKETKEALLVNGKTVTSKRSFIPETPDGSIEITFKFNGTGLAGKTVVAFEEISVNSKVIAVHADLSDADQTIHIPEIGTTALDAETESHKAVADKKVTIVDTVTFKNLVPGKEYTVTGTLMDKGTGKALEISGKPVTAKKTFKPEGAAGSINITFTFDGSSLAGKSVVAFESLSYGGVEIAAHQDINDKDQTVSFGETDTSDGDKPKTTVSRLGKGPKTGDTNHVAAYIVLMTAAMGGALWILRHLRKRQPGDKEKE